MCCSLPCHENFSPGSLVFRPRYKIMSRRDGLSAVVLVVRTLCGLFLVGLGTTSQQSYVLRFTIQPRSTIEAEGKNASFSCRAVSLVGPVTYRWRVNETTWLQSTSNSVTITNLQRHGDNGVYRCVAVSSVGSILSNKATLQVAYFDVFDSELSTTRKVKKYESTILQAPCVQSVPPARYKWELNGKLIEDGHSNNMFISPNGDLSVIGPQKSYDFTCIVQNPITNQTVRKIYTLKIEGRFKHGKDTSFLKTPKNKVIDAGSPMVVFECIADVVLRKERGIIVPLPVFIRWYKDSDVNKISVEGSSKYGYLKNTTALKMKLVVYAPDKDDEGGYYCSATKANPQELIKSPIGRLTVKDPPPKFSTHAQIPSSITKWPGERIEFTCPHLNDGEASDDDDDDDDDSITRTWYKDAQQVVEDGIRVIVNEGNLIINSLKTTDAGFYQVVVRNNEGEAIGNATYLEVKDNVSSSVQPSQTKTQSPMQSTSVVGIYNSSTGIAIPKTTHLRYTSQPTSTKALIPTRASQSPTSSILRPTSTSATPSILSPSTTAIFTKRRSTSSPISPTFSTAFSSMATPTTSTEISTSSIGIILPTTPIVTQTTVIYNNTVAEPSTHWTTDGVGWETTQKTTTKNTEELNSRNKSANDGENGLMIWIAVAVGGFVVLSIVIVTVVYCCSKGKLPRKQSFKLQQEKYDELELNSLTRRGQGTGKCLSVIDKSSPRNIPGVDTKHLLTDDDDVLYAPVTALDNIAADIKDNESPPQGPVYAEPFKSTKRNPYLHPLPSTPDSNTGNFEERPVSSHSYLELLGPDEAPLNVYAEPKEGELNDFAKNAVKLNESIYDCAREGVLTNTLRRIMKQDEQGKNDSNQRMYHVLEEQPIQNGLKRESSLYANPEDILSGTLEPSSNDRLSRSEPLYHVLEPLGNFSAKQTDADNRYEYYRADEPIKRESVYQPLMNFNINSDVGRSSVYQALDFKARSPSAPSSGPHRTDNEICFNGNSNRDSRSLTDPKRLSGYSENGEDLYQPLNNSERCPLNVSKPRASFNKLRTNPEPGSFLSFGEGSSSPSSSLKSYHEPTLHAVDLSPSGSLKEHTKSRPGHRRNRSDTHIIVNIANLNQRRASVQGPGISSTNSEQHKFRHKRNHSDAGLCPVNLSHLRVSIDLDSPKQDDSNNLYMALIKTGIYQGDKE